jgi:hypothetical protein
VIVSFAPLAALVGDAETLPLKVTDMSSYWNV